MILKNVKVYTEDKRFEEGEIRIEEGRFAGNEGAGEGIELDGKGCYAIPGLIDLHFHGCKGYDFCDGNLEAIQEIAKYEASVGVTAIAPATMTLPVEELDVWSSILVSVSKRRFKRAVKRNRVKRQIREAYRLNKQPLLDSLSAAQCRVAIAFIYLADELVDTSVIESKMKIALARIAEKVSVRE